MNSHIAFLFSCLVISLITSTISASGGGNETDYQALLKFKSVITNEEALSSWNTSFHFCDWSGVSCGKRHRRVTSLILDSQGLEGSLSPHVGNLSFLRVFSLKNNSFQGTIPHELGRLSRLLILRLSSNIFDGVIPTNLSRCSNMELLTLANNQLVGSIPKEISFLSKLIFFSVEINKLTGGITPVLGNLTSMEVFSLVGNPLSGSIPDTFGHCKRLNYFTCGSCNLSGTIPTSIYNLSLLTHFSLPDNQLTGSLPSTIGAMLPNLEYLQLRDNQLTGPLPSSLSNCSKLHYLEMNYNNFKGSLGIDFSKLKDIEFISIGSNIFGFGEDDDMKFIDTLTNCSKLRWLALSDCAFQGVLPSSIGNFSDQLSTLVLQRNQFYGHLPSSIGNLIGLETFYLRENRFTRQIPSPISKLQNLQIASLEYNQFSGPIPDGIGNLSLLTKLGLNSNKLERIPSSIGNCHRLAALYLDDNKLTGGIPKQLLQLSSLTIILNLSQNNLSGSLPIEVGELKLLSYLDLSENDLSGNIPSSLSGCTSLVFLSLKGNLFEGMIPSSLSSMRGISTLHLSHNNLSGQIPEFSKRYSFEYVNLSFNNFEGEVPTIGVFSNTSKFSVLGNNRLCGGLAELGLPKCKETSKHKKRFPLFAIVILIASALLGILCFIYAWCKKRKGHPSQSSRDEQFMKISYGQLLKATNGFSNTNLIGEGGFGSVYKGILDQDDRIVAVKVIHLQNRGAHKSFIAECEAWRSIRHRNLLKIITSCSSVDFQGNDFKGLIYEFMPNGSLHDWLHSSKSTSRLNLLQRINILIDVASAIDYLHNRCLPTMIHCDLKPSNILLDDDFVAHVGDFGLTRFLGTNQNQNNTSGITGTIGYAPPKYGVGSEMTSSGDVYSFGILLLEMMTGKSPTDDIFKDGLSLHKFAHMALPNNVNDVIDDDLLNHLQEDAITTQHTLANVKKTEECLASTVKIGVSCSIESPTQRVNIENVVHGLQHIMDKLQNIEVPL